MLKVLKIKAVKVGMEVEHVYRDGLLLERDAGFHTNQVILSKFINVTMNLTSLSIELQLPNVLSIPFMLRGGLLNLGYFVLGTELKFKDGYVYEILKRRKDKQEREARLFRSKYY